MIPSPLSKIAEQIPKAKRKPPIEERIAQLKEEYGLFHGKGNHKRKRGKKKKR